MSNGWIKLHRQMMEWEWYTDGSTFKIFLHLILLANHEPKSWKGVFVERGQIIIGRKKLSKDTGVSEQSVRTSLQRLKDTQEITIKSTNKFSIVTINNYGKYQLREDTNQQTNQQSTSNQPATNHKQEGKKVRSKETYVCRIETETLFNSIEEICTKYGMENGVNKKSLDVIVERYVGKVRMKVELQHCVSWLLDKGLKKINTQRIGNWFKKAQEIQKRDENKQLERDEVIGQNQGRNDFSIDPAIKSSLQKNV